MDLLVVEDDDAVAGALVHALEAGGHRVTRVATGAAGLDRVAATPPPELVLLDLGLPDLDGFEVGRRIRALSAVPIIVVSARDEEADRVIALELGADDYLVKPFGARELLARIRAVSRRTSGQVEPRSAPPGPVQIDPRTRRATVHGVPLDLTPKEHDLLAYLAEDPGAVKTRMEILRGVWDPHWYGPSKTLDVHMASLRRKLVEASPEAANLIETVRGVGFRLAVD